MDTLNKLQPEAIISQSPKTKELFDNPILNYREYVRPKLTDMLNCLKLDIPYKIAKGNTLKYTKTINNEAKEISVIDFVGGFGANVLGHNNPELKKTLIDALNSDLPNLSQCSVRVNAGILAQKLNSLLPSQGKYICNFSNSGTESVEAALKHAFKVRTDTIQRKHDIISTGLNAVRDRYQIEPAYICLPEGYQNLEQIVSELQEFNAKELGYFLENPMICAYKSAFHGKTTSSLKVTFNKTFREGYEGMSALNCHFFDTDKPQQIKELADAQMLTFKYIEIENEALFIKTWQIPRVFAFIMEVILGEGGILIQPDNVLAELCSLHKIVNIPFIIDEIQTGCGRTGTFFAYEQTPLREIEPEYITLSKALGGGLCKIGVTMIHENVYDHEFGLVHTSTFAEDDVSSAIALKVIEILTRNDNELMQEAILKGELILNKLKKIQEKYPDIIKEIRGRGLMIGIEFSDLGNYGPFFRYAGSQGFIALLMASYILHYHNIRVLSPLTTMFKGNPGKKRRPVIRIQPSVYVTSEEIDKLCNALDDVLNIIAKNNEYVLMAHLFDKELPEEIRLFPEPIPVLYPEIQRKPNVDGRIGFIVHITELQYLLDYYLPSFEKYNYRRRDLIKWWDRLSRFLEPDLMFRTYVTHNKKTIEANIMCVPYLPKYMIKTYVEGQDLPENERDNKIFLLDMQDKIQEAIIKAKDMGDNKIPLNIVGLGAYNSIVSNNGLALDDNIIPVTTGNAFTTALVYMGIKEAVKKKKLEIDKLTAVVIGASGNIGTSLTYLLGNEVGKIFLIGRDKVLSYNKLSRSKELCLARILENIRLQLSAGSDIDDIKLKGFANDIYNYIIKPALKKENNPNKQLSIICEELLGDKVINFATGKLLDTEINQYYGTKENPFIVIEDLSIINQCDIVVLATNSSDSWLINPDNIKKSAIICCASVPSNLSETFKDNSGDYFVFDGGYALLPENNEIDFVGMPKYGNVYGCLAETMLIGFEGEKKSFARGEITVSHIIKIIELAEKHGFKLGKFLLGDNIQHFK